MIDRDTDLLISRILDRQAEPGDFDAFADQAGAEPEAWSGLLAALRDDVALGVAADARLAVAERIEAPVIQLRAPRALPAWSGWAAALLLACAWLGWGGADTSTVGLTPDRSGNGAVADGSPGLAGSPGPASTQPHVAGMFGDNGPRLRDGAVVPAADHVLGELSPELISARPALDGTGVDVTYVRRVLERARVDSAWSIGTDEFGNPAPIQVDLALLTSSDQQ